MHEITGLTLRLSSFAARKVKDLTVGRGNLQFKFRIYITGGGCSGFKYGFVLDNSINEDDCIIEQEGVTIVVDPISLQYLVGGLLDYKEELTGSRFIVINPNAKITCSCGSSFGI